MLNRSNLAVLMGQIVQRLCRVQFRRVPFFAACYTVSGEVIEAAHAKVLALPPPIYSLYIPNPKASIIDFLKTNLPVQSLTLIMYSAAGAVKVIVAARKKGRGGTADGMGGE